MAKSKISKACDISQKVKEEVWERDGHRCIICGSPIAMPNAHFISRANHGLGIPENIVTLCTNFSENKCHYRYDFGTKEESEEIREKIKEYLMSIYPDWNEEDLVYKKYDIDRDEIIKQSEEAIKYDEALDKEWKEE